MIHKELNQARIEQKTAAKSLKTKERAKLFYSLKGSKYTLLKAEDKLSNKQKKIRRSQGSFSISKNHALFKRRVPCSF
ncbi:hypothetical protein AB0759_02015 [Scytonema tolypothrichoides VB-61278_2]